MKLQQRKEAIVRAGLGCKHSLSSGVSVHSLLLLEAHMLEASLYGVWSLRSQSVLLTDAHNFAEGAEGLVPHLSNSQRGGTPQLAYLL